MRTIAVIPARMGSSRFPGKPLALIHGRPMLQWVFEGTRSCPLVDETVIATCDPEIQSAAESFGARAIMTSERHERASDRVAEASERLRADVVVMVQGDEPMVTPEMVSLSAEPVVLGAATCTNLAAPIMTAEEFADLNTVKVVFSRSGRAMFFSRAPVPALRDAAYAPTHGWRQVCVITFAAQTLREYAELPPTAAEQTESIDMLRLLEHDRPVEIRTIASGPFPVDTPADLRHVESLLERRLRT